MREIVRSRFPVDGAGKIELFDERHKLIELVPFTNFVAPEGLAHNRWQVRQDFHEDMPGANNLDVETTYPFSHVMLTDSGQAENTGETWPLGIPVGWANKVLYSGADVLRGSVNAEESAADTDSVTWVFDWPTQAAIGTIGSVIWCPLTTGTNAVWTTLRSTLLFTALVTGWGSASNVVLSEMAADNSGNVWAVGRPNGTGMSSSNRIVLLDRTTGTILVNGPTFSGLGYSTASGSGTVGLAVDSSQMFTSQAGVIHRFTIPIDGSAPSKTVVPTPGGESTIRGLGCDDTYLWVVGGSGTLYRIDKTTGAIERQFTPSVLFPTETVTGVCYNPVDGLLYTTGFSGSALFGSTSGNGATVRRWTLDGTPIGASIIAIASLNGSQGVITCDPTGKLVVSNTQTNAAIRQVDTATDGVMGTRARLANPIIKSTVQTMKLTYTFTFS